MLSDGHWPVLASGATSLIPEDPLKPLESKAVIWKLIWQMFGDLFHELDGWKEICGARLHGGEVQSHVPPQGCSGWLEGRECKDQSWLRASQDGASSAFSASSVWWVGSPKKL